MKRFLRIYPAFVVSVLVCALILGPLVTIVPVSQYFVDPAFFTFFRNLTLYSTNYDLPGVFTTTPSHGVNGVYWTLPIEFTMYMLIAAMAPLGLLKARWALVLAVLFFLLHQITPYESGHILRMPKFFFTLYGYLFFAGAAMNLVKERIPMDFRLFALLLIIGLGCIKTPWGNPIMYICMPYVVIYIALAPLGALSRFGRYGDFSYGIYLWGFPMQQLLVLYYGVSISVTALFLGAWGLALILAVISWHGVEHPMLNLKKRLRAS